MDSECVVIEKLVTGGGKSRAIITFVKFYYVQTSWGSDSG